MTRPIMLVVLDGFGVGDGGASDSTALAHTPFFDHARERYPQARIETSGEAVGLPPGQMGNSEVGHMTMGAGRVIEQELTRIRNALVDRGAASVPALQRALEDVAQTGGTLHLMGLVSDGGVHSHVDHLGALLDYASECGIPTAVHAFLDGRDTPPRSGLEFIEELSAKVDRTGARIATVIGRYFAMDRDNRWDRVGRAYHAMVSGEGHRAKTAVDAVRSAYQRGENDEFVEPTVVEGSEAIGDGDAVICFNFRADRAREITNALTGAKPEQFAGQLERQRVVELSTFVCLTEYDETFGLPCAFAPQTPRKILGEVVSEAGYSQLRVAETEKYAHVTFFFNGGVEPPFPGEDRILVPSPRDVATYDHKPEMSAQQVTERVVSGIADGEYDFILLNYANPDMVGHTGVLDAAVKAVEMIDRGLEQICHSVLQCGGEILITADHGNCELMVDPRTGEPHTAHTTNPVPLYWITRDPSQARLRDGGLADLAPTVLERLGLDVPSEMTGRSLIVSEN
ncbi:2,3-bisphosphoglycerate-independent phosphoglycerate mutase [Myxococcota bacterium]|nr:2,3-bisphosphoglycerate-independent phosphoglycerate mutase [Myxococcota bacterium]